MANVSFFRCERSVFNTKTSGQLTPGGLYFITDENVIIEATSDSDFIEYGGKVKIIASNGSFPSASSAIPGCLYIKGTTGKVSDGSNWAVAFDSPVQTSSSVLNGDTNPVSGDAVYDYIDGLTVSTGGTSSQANKVPTLNADGKLDNSFLPALAISEFLGTVTKHSGATGTETDLSSLNDTAERGDWAIVSTDSAGGNAGSYICTAAAVYTDTVLTTSATWQRLADKLDEITVDGTVSSNSSNPVSSSGIYSAIEAAKLTWTDWTT